MILPRYNKKRCRQCGGEFQPRQIEQDFCHPVCKRKWWNTARDRSAQVYALLVQWRTTRGAAKGCLGEIARRVDEWIAKDRITPKGQ